MRDGGQLVIESRPTGVTNAQEYNGSLTRRGQLSLYCPDGDLKALFINDTPYQKGVWGQSQTYSDAYLELLFMFYRLSGWGMRPITGHMQEFWALRGLEIAVPGFGLLSERLCTLKVLVKQRCQRVADCLSRGEAISLIVDSSGMKFGRASEWHRQKYGRDAGQTPWRKMHLSIDPEMMSTRSRLPRITSPTRRAWMRCWRSTRTSTA
ncbi:transposase [Paraburkholderia sediminicola]|uniref:transposase n=1 Tax=Paraburkholderia sediminicola TaxID=458836 RepID=UPI0038BC2C4A